MVDVTNHMPGHDESIHWHGVLQRGTPWMDGVPYITQCPIHSGSTFRYAFCAMDPGTHYWHSHHGHQKVDGIFGSLIVRNWKEKEPNADQYQCDIKEHVIVINDWFHYPASMMVPGLQNISQIPVSYMINGRGPYRDAKTGTRTRVPLSVFRMDCSKCSSYRFRVINSDSSVCPISFRVSCSIYTEIMFASI